LESIDNTERDVEEMNWEEYMGVQTLLLKERGGQTDAQAIVLAVNRIREAGFKTIEITPAQFNSVAGREAAISLENIFPEGERRNLRNLLKAFRVVTVHGSNITIQVQSKEDKKNEYLWRPYLELMRFARDLGAHIVTFHSLKRAEGAHLTDGEMIAYYIEFGKLAARYAQEWNLLAGFELATDYKFFVENRIVDRIGSERFGYLFDVGHVALYFPESPDITGSVLQVVEASIDRIFEFHAGGVQRTSQGLREHRPLEPNNILDHGRLMELLARKKYRNPIIFEIFFHTSRPEQSQASFSENLDVCIAAKQQLLKGEKTQ
jgi:sugar phosphate isomerase/epimerase